MQNGTPEAVKLDEILVKVRTACRVLRRAEAAGDGAALRKGVAEVRTLLEPFCGEASVPDAASIQNSWKEALEAIDAAERPTPAVLGHVCAALCHEEADADGLKMVLSKLVPWFEQRDPVDRIQAESVNVGLPEIVVNFIRSRGRNSAELMGLVCRIVYLMCHDHPMAAGALVRYGAGTAVIECMDLHPDDVTVQTNVLQAIGELVEWGRGGRQVAHAMAVQHVFGALSRLPKEPLVQAAGCVTLDRLFREGGAPTTGMAEAAVRAKANCPEDESVIQEADALIETLET